MYYFFLTIRATWVAQWVECWTLVMTGHDLTVHGIKPHIRLCADSMEPAWDSLSPSLSLPFPTSCSQSLMLSLFQNK